MGDRNFYLLAIFLIVYIISPFDFVPGFIDDLIASGTLWYYWRKWNTQKRGKSKRYAGDQFREQQKRQYTESSQLEEAYRVLGVSPDASWKDVRKAYKEKIAKSHPDKVAHLGEELQDKAKEITLQLNKAVDVIRRHKSV
ncbi:MAG: DnaJ domain-containing protein [Candidatus Scalindua sp.]|nr:DnaJ domain-containing protein [Candidatus Scalindua sp.]